MTSKSAVAAIPCRRSSLRRTRVAALLLATPLAAMTWQATHAATVEFRLSPDSKGREQRIASELAAWSVRRLQRAPVMGCSASRQTTTTKLPCWRPRCASVPGSLGATAARRQAPGPPGAGERISQPHAGVESARRSSASATVARLAERTGLALTLRRVTYGNRALVVAPAGTSSAALAALAVTAAGDSAVRSAERVRVYRHQWIPNDTNGANSGRWVRALVVSGQPSVGYHPTGGVAVAVIDTGIRSHPDLDSKRLSGYDMIRDTFISTMTTGAIPTRPTPVTTTIRSPSTGSWDFMSSWHGNHVAGIIAASTNNGEGIAGLPRMLASCRFGRWGVVAAPRMTWRTRSAGLPVLQWPVSRPIRILRKCSISASAAAMARAAPMSRLRLTAHWPRAPWWWSRRAMMRRWHPISRRPTGGDCRWRVKSVGDLSSYSNFGNTVGISARVVIRVTARRLSTLNGGITLPAVPSYATSWVPAWLRRTWRVWLL